MALEETNDTPTSKPACRATRNGPPPYNSQQSRASTQHTHFIESTVLNNPMLPNIPPSNYQLVIQDSRPITGTFVIDPTLSVPDDLLAGNVLLAESIRNLRKEKNLVIESKRGQITANIWLVGGDDVTRMADESKGARRAVIDIKSHHCASATTVKMYSASPLPYCITIQAKYTVFLSIPTDFTGPVLLDIHGAIEFSDLVKSRLTAFSEVNGKRTCFIGDYRNSRYMGRFAWTGSTITVKTVTSGSLYICFVGEELESSTSGCIVM